MADTSFARALRASSAPPTQDSDIVLDVDAATSASPAPATSPPDTHDGYQDDATTEAVASDATLSGLLAASRPQLLAKRALDILVSTLVLVVCLPVLILAALAIKLTSAGPTLYVGERVGRDGRAFKMYKFRSMYDGAGLRRADLAGQNEVDGPAFKMRRDPRVTPVGRTLRKLSIDEMPQLLNVLKGDMSLVGPRPPLPADYELFTEYQRQRMAVRPGLTCTWQVSGRSDIPFDQWLDMDLDYIATWNMRRDIGLLVRTIPAVVTGRGAY